MFSEVFAVGGDDTSDHGDQLSGKGGAAFE